MVFYIRQTSSTTKWIVPSSELCGYLNLDTSFFDLLCYKIFAIDLFYPLNNECRYLMSKRKNEITYVYTIFHINKKRMSILCKQKTKSSRKMWNQILQKRRPYLIFLVQALQLYSLLTGILFAVALVQNCCAEAKREVTRSRARPCEAARPIHYKRIWINAWEEWR